MKGNRIFLLCVFFVSLLENVGANTWRVPETYDNETDILEKWKILDSSVKTTIQSLVKTAMPTVLEMNNELNLSSQCTKESLKLITGLRQLKLWAVGFLDSSSKGPNGFLSGSLSNYGDYDQCLDTVVPHPKLKDNILFRGQYCIAEVRFPLPSQRRRYKLNDQLEDLQNFTGTETMNFLASVVHFNYLWPVRLGICVPSGCSMDDIKQMASYAGNKTHVLIEVPHCEVRKEKTEFLPVQICAIMCCIVLSLFVLVGTWLDVHKKKYDANQSKVLKLMICFSVATNFKKLVRTKTSDESFKCLHGVRFLTIMWVIHGHAFLYPAWFLQNYRAMFRIEELTQQTFVQMLVNGSEAVDTFFFMAGMLLCYFTVTRVVIQKKKFNLKSVVLHRLWRIVPVYYFITLCYFLVPLLGSGPMFHDIIDEAMGPCFQYWWRNLLFINNVFSLKDVCFMHTWYISVDMQLHLITLIALFPLIKRPRAGITIVLVAIAGSVFYTGMLNYILRVPAAMTKRNFDPKDRSLFYVHSYASTISRVGPYFIGVFFGYILAMKPKIKLPKGVLLLGWCAAALSSGLVIYAPAFWYHVQEPSFLAQVMYGAFFKVAFTGGVGWMIFCCVTGNGGFINTFLSWKAWVPLSRLTFLIYLIQPAFQTVYIASYKYAQDTSHIQTMIHSFGFLCISGLIAVVFVLLVESPFMQMEKILSGGEKKEAGKTNGELELGIRNGELTVATERKPAISTVFN